MKSKMEGPGQEVIAIFRSLNDGLAVTLLSSPRDQSNRRSSSQVELEGLKPAKNSSVETNTDILHEGKPSRDRQTDTYRYISCYQMAHCSSHPLSLREFSAQKSKPNVNEGSFGIGSPESSIAKSCARADHLAAETRWRKKSIVSCNGTSRCMEDFVNSLRKYPSMSPERSISSELVAKLLKHTQNKHYQNAKTTSMKSSDRVDEDSSPKKTKDPNIEKIEKRRENRRECNFTVRHGLRRNRRPNKSTGRGFYYKKPKHGIMKNNPVGINSPGISIVRNSSPLSTTYNYLRASQYHQPGHQIRLGELGKELQKTLKLVCQRHPVVVQICPNIQKRYERHKKICPKKSTSTIDTNKTQKKASISKLSRLHSAISNICEEPCCSKIIPRNYCYCNKATQYISDTDTKSNRDNVCQCCPKMHSQSTQQHKDRIPDRGHHACQCKDLTDTELNDKVDKAVAEWLNEIPVPANEKAEDKILRENLVKELAGSLKLLPNDEDLEDSIKEAIENSIANIPMWKPGTINDQEHIKEDLVNNLLNNVIPIVKKTDKLSNIVKLFVKSINFIDDKINKQGIIDNIITKLKDCANSAPVNNNDFKIQLEQEVTTILEGLPIKYTEDKTTTLNRLANRLAHDAICYFRTTNIDGTESRNDTLKDHPSGKFDEDEYESMDKKQVVKILKDLTTKIDELESQISTTNKIKTELDSVLQFRTPTTSNDYLSETVTNNALYEKKHTKFEEALKAVSEDFDDQSLLEDSDHKPDIIKKDWTNQFDTKMKLEEVPGKNKDADRHIALEEMKHELEVVPIDKKKYLQSKLRDILDESSDKPFTESVLKDVNEKIENLIADTEMDEDAKSNLINKLTNIAKYRLDENTNESRKDYVQRMFLKDLNSKVNKLPISEEMKNNLKQSLETTINENFEKPFTSDVKNIISDNIAEVIQNSVLPEHLKEDLKNTLTNIADEKLGNLPQQTTVDYAKETLVKGVKGLFDDIPLPRNQKKYLINGLGRVITESLDQPFSGTVKNDLKSTLKDIIVKSEIDSSTKNELTKKLSDIVNKQLDMLPHQTAEGYAKDDIMRNIMRMVDNKSLAKRDIDILKNKFKDIIDTSFQQQHLSDIRSNMRKGINDIIHQLPISKNEKDDLLNVATDIVGKILDESFYNDDTRLHLDDIYSDIDKRKILMPEKSILKNKYKIIVDDHSKDKEFPDVNDLVKEGLHLIKKSDNKSEDEIFINESTMNDTLNVVDDMQISHDKKSTLKNNLREILLNNLNKTRDRKEILQEINKTVEKLPITWTEMKYLKSKLACYLAPNSNESQKRLKSTFLKDIEKAIDEESFSGTKKSLLKNNIAKYLDSLEDPISSKTKNKIKNNLTKFIHENLTVKEKRNELKNKIGKIVDSLPTDLEDANIMKEKVISIVNDITDEAWIRPHIKEAMKKEFQAIIEDNFNQPLGKNTLVGLKDAIYKVIDRTPITDYQRDDLKQKLLDSLNTMTSMLSTVRSDSIGSRTEPKAIFSQPLRHSTRNEEMFDATDDRIDFSEMSSIPKQDESKSVKTYSKTTLLKDFHDILRDAHLSENKRGDLTNALNDAIGVRVDKLHSHPNKDRTIAKKEIEANIGEILNQMSVPENQKNNIKSQLMNAVNKYIDTIESDSAKFSNQRTKLFRNTESIINLLPVADHVKETLKNKLKVIIPDVSKETEEPVTSTPKKGRKTWGEVDDILSTIPDDNLIQFLSPEENNYWTQVIKAMHQWIDSQPVDIDDDTRNRIKKGLLSDIDDRQKYLQMNPAAKKTLQEELENLQYQIYRKLNKFLDDSDMTVVMAATDGLMQAMQEITPPQTMQENSLQTGEDQKKFEDIINDWVTKMPLKEQSAMEKLEMSKKAVKLARVLKDIKRNDNKLSNEDVKKNMAKEIMQFIKNLPMKVDQKKYLDKYSQKLIDILEAIKITGQIDTSTEIGDGLSELDDIRQYNQSGTDSFDPDGKRQSTRIGAGLSLPDGIRRPSQIEGDLFRTDGIRHFETSGLNIVGRDLSGLDDIQEQTFPPCYLSVEDKEHLRSIKKRACLAPDCTTSLLRNRKQDASVNPMANETGSQTDIDLEFLDGSSVPRSCRMTLKSKPVRDTTPCTDRASQIEVQPQVIVKEYFWDSTNTPTPMMSTNYHGRENCKCRRSPRRRLLFESANLCPAAKNICHRITDGMPTQTCQDWPTSQRTRSPSPTPDNLIIQNSFRPSTMLDQSSPRMSPDINKSDKESRRNSSPEHPDISTSRQTRRDGLTDTGTSSDRNPTRRTAAENNFDWCSEFPEEAWKPPCIRRECMTRYNPCKDRTKSPLGDNQKCFRRSSRINCGVGPPCSDPSDHWSTFCEPCARCPYPSYLYFRQ